MAKIYETPLDVERADLKEKALASRNAAQNSLDSGIIGALIASGSYTAETLSRFESAVSPNMPKTFGRGFVNGANTVLKWCGVFMAVTSAISWFGRRSDAIKAEAKLQVLGQEEVVYPPISDMIAASQGKYCDRLQQEVASTHRSL